MLFEEELARMEEEEELRDNVNNSMKGDLLNEYIHLAIDTRAKWKLRNLFNTSLNISNYLVVVTNE